MKDDCKCLVCSINDYDCEWCEKEKAVTVYTPDDGSNVPVCTECAIKHHKLHTKEW